MRPWKSSLLPRPVGCLPDALPQRQLRAFPNGAPPSSCGVPLSLAFPRASGRAEKVARLKQAKAEAESEIAAYKADREAQFAIFSKERMGDSGAHSAGLNTATEKELVDIANQARDRPQRACGSARVELVVHWDARISEGARRAADGGVCQQLTAVCGV